LEKGFEKLTTVAIGLLGKSVFLIIALIAVVYWLTDDGFFIGDLHHCIGDIIPGVAFLS
jgi:hypothetical protein